MDFDWNCLLGKFQSCTSRSRRCKIICSRKTVYSNDIQRAYRVMQNQHNVEHETFGLKTDMAWT